MYGNVLKIQIWIPHEKIGDPYIFILSPILELFPLYCNKIKSISASVLIFGIPIGTDEGIT